MKQNLSEKTVLSILSARLKVSVPEVAEQCGIPPSTIVGILNRLESKRLVSSQAGTSQGRGRPVISYRLRMCQPVPVILVDGSQLSGAIFNEDFEALAIKTSQFNKMSSLDEATSVIKKHLDGLLLEAGVNRSQFSEVAIVLNGIFLGNRVLESSVLPWANDLLVETLSKVLDFPVRLVSRRSLMLAEYHRLPGPWPHSMVNFCVGDGVSANALIADKIYEGVSFRSGQIGHVVYDPQGPLCGCGRQGCLEALTNGQAIQSKIVEALGDGFSQFIAAKELENVSTRNTIELIWNAWKNGDSFICTRMEEVFDCLGWAVGIVVNLLDPEVVVFGSYVLNDKPEWVEEIRSRSRRWTFDAMKRDTRFETSRVTVEDQLRAIACCTTDNLPLHRAANQ